MKSKLIEMREYIHRRSYGRIPSIQLIMHMV